MKYILQKRIVSQIAICVFVILLGCKANQNTKKSVTGYSSISNFSTKEIKINRLVGMDSLKIDGKKMSMSGNFFTYQDSLYFADCILASVLVYDKDCHYVRSIYKKGRGPMELSGLDVMTVLPSGDFVIMDEQWGITVCDTAWNKVKKFMLEWKSTKSLEELRRDPDPEDMGIYEVEYAKNKICAYGEQRVIFPITTEAMNLNAFEGRGTRRYYDESYMLAILSLQSGVVEKMICKFSPVYKKYTYLPNLKNVLFETKGNELYYSFEVDPLIYKMNLTDSTTISFGEAGLEMNTNYRETTLLEDAERYLSEDMENYGHYRYLRYIAERNILFRGYRKGKGMRDGLQVYSENCLIADIEVPRDFEVVGYIAPWFYARGICNYDDEEIVIYKFELE